MINHAVIIDPNSNHREEIARQLESIHSCQVLHFSKAADAFKMLGTLESYEGAIFVSRAACQGADAKVLSKFRSRSLETYLLFISESISPDDVEFFIRIGADQVLLIPTEAEELKKRIMAAEKYRNTILNLDSTNPPASMCRVSVDELTEELFRVSFVGMLAENTNLPIWTPEKPATLILDCERLRTINSAGLKSWLLWIKALTDNGMAHFEFENLGPGFLQLASFVEGFIPAGGSVNSFYLHYFCEEKNQTKNFRFVRGIDFDSEEMRIPSFWEVLENGTVVTYKLDDSVPFILRFFKGKIELV